MFTITLNKWHTKLHIQYDFNCIKSSEKIRRNYAEMLKLKNKSHQGGIMVISQPHPTQVLYTFMYLPIFCCKMCPYVLQSLKKVNSTQFTDIFVLYLLS